MAVESLPRDATNLALPLYGTGTMAGDWNALHWWYRDVCEKRPVDFVIDLGNDLNKRAFLTSATQEAKRAGAEAVLVSAYTSMGQYAHGIRFRPRDRARPGPLTDTVRPTAVSWHPSGTSVAVGSTAYDLWTIDLGGGLPTAKLAIDGKEKRSPAWSPDGQRIAFERDGQLWVYGLGDRLARRLTTDGGRSRSRAWSPDGTRIAYTHRSGSDNEIWIIETTTGNAAPVPGTRGGNSPTWAPNGSALAFVSVTSPPFAYALQRIDVDGGHPRDLIARDEPLIDSPAWSPDGRWIAFSRYPPMERAPAWDDIWVVPADGGAPRVCTGSSGDNTHPAWSPDGMQIAFISTRGCNPHGDPRLWILDVSGDQPCAP
jgi:Tol biopolymer transport system component